MRVKSAGLVMVGAGIFCGAAAGANRVVHRKKSAIHSECQAPSAPDFARQSPNSKASSQEPASSKNLPCFTVEELRSHADEKSGIWVSLGHDVFDVTNWVSKHPGTNLILACAGGPLEPMFAFFPFHFHPDIVTKILAPMKIGTLEQSPSTTGTASTESEFTPFAFEPARDQRMPVLQQTPFVSETPPEVRSLALTPNELFHVHNHLPVPDVERLRENYGIAISVVEVVGGRTISRSGVVTLADLKEKFEHVCKEEQIKCHGIVNGRAPSPGQVGNAQWCGVPLSAVLLAFGVTPPDHTTTATTTTPDQRHVHIFGHDGFHISIPLVHCMQPPNTDTSSSSSPSQSPSPSSQSPSKIGHTDSTCLLAFSMNGKDLPVDHGFPVRFVAPRGLEGARSVKWVYAVVVKDSPAVGVWQKRYCSPLEQERS